jgi:hypothetical protein
MNEYTLNVPLNDYDSLRHDRLILKKIREKTKDVSYRSIDCSTRIPDGLTDRETMLLLGDILYTLTIKPTEF